MCYYFRRYSLVNNSFNNSIYSILSSISQDKKEITNLRQNNKTFNNTVRKIIINKKIIYFNFKSDFK